MWWGQVKAGLFFCVVGLWNEKCRMETNTKQDEGAMVGRSVKRVQGMGNGAPRRKIAKPRGSELRVIEARRAAQADPRRVGVVAVAPDQRGQTAVADGHVVGVDDVTILPVLVRADGAPGIVASENFGSECRVVLPEA